MHFTPKKGLVICAILTAALIAATTASVSRVPLVPVAPRQMVLASEITSTPDFRSAGSGYYQPVSSWYSSKHWWKRNAPIVGGAGGGALVGGLVGGGAGAVIGGAAGAGGGYLYKRHKDHHRHHHYNEYNYKH